jgi:hypothetical protein
MSEMDLQTTCELLLKIEQEVDVNDMFHEDAHLWPLVRQFIWVNSLQGNNRHNKSSGKENRIAALSKKKPTIIDHLNHIVHDRETTRQIKRSVKTLRQFITFSRLSADVCFLSQPIYYSETLNGRPYSRIIDPFYELLSTRVRCLKLEQTLIEKKQPCRAYPSYVFNVLPVKVQVEQEIRETLQKCRKTLRAIFRVAGGDEADLLQGLSVGLQAAIKSRDTYLQLFNSLRPKMIFLACYYFPAFMGLNWAAKIKGVASIDIQHGKQGKYHGMYSHWTKIPQEGYALLPKWFWSWGTLSADNIMKWQADRTSHRCVVGGNPWISRWNSKEFSTNELVRPNAEKIILVTTQAPVGDFYDFFPEMLVDAIKMSPADWLWIIREHPNFKQGNSLIQGKLKAVDSSKYKIGIHNKFPLYSLLAICDFHVTAFSSVCYEADFFSVPTAIFSDIGKKLYCQEIEVGRFAFCEEWQDLINAIAYFRIKKDDAKYIESDKKLFSSALQIVSEGSGIDLAFE